MVYRVGKGLKILAFVFSCLALALVLDFVSMARQSTATSGQVGLYWFLAVFFIVFSLLLVLSIVRARVTIDDHSILVRGIFRTRSIGLRDIEGYRIIVGNRLLLVHKTGGRSLQMPSNLERQRELVQWVRARFDNLGGMEPWRERKAILANEAFGDTEDARWMSLKRAKSIASAGTVNAIALLLWEMVYPEPREWLMIVLLAAPWVAVYAIWYSKGLIRLASRKDSVYPSLILLLVLPVVGVLVAILRDYMVYQFAARGWVLVGTGGLITAAICIIACRKAIEKEKVLSFICILAISCAYSFGLIFITNCYYDRSVPAHWRVRVLSKRVSTDSKLHYLELSAWGRFGEGNSEEVSEVLYNGINTGDSVNIDVGQGKWKIPWYWIRK
ncbi:PH domain-containing protein [Flavitalea sp. BT771]|uniref:PH domain-containing protein n=1 Tax=Flavitalea sp. BT771 TaxID=3063329 RepID=UPI0026E4201B|nr:PH domain-containing protein [Flavitalea sp. BT771]MDO6433326.1 PH domain-containing protein [Flavitalea sp. BT771]MDV6222769.1 PH domain-containing protein [Flavitalea sp. BT771]